MGYSLGIDVGTTFTAAAVWRDERVEVVALEAHRVALLREQGALERTPEGRLRLTLAGFPLLDAVIADLAA